MARGDDCPFCKTEIAALKAQAAEIEKRAPAPTTLHPAEAQQHTTAVLMDVVIERLLGELGHPMRVVRVLCGRVFGIAGVNLQILGMVEATAADIAADAVAEVQPTTDDVRDLTEADLAGMKDLPTA